MADNISTRIEEVNNDAYTHEDDLTPKASTSNAHLSFPSASRPRSPTPPTIAPPARELSKNRLYVGNLHPSVDEYTLLQVFHKYGKISKLDFLFHKSGPMKGKPRGYAFVEYNDKEDALKALVNAHDKLLRGRKIVVTYANQAPNFDPGPSGSRPYHRRTELDRPTTLSLLKSNNRLTKTEDKIAALEAKLRQLEQPEEKTSTLPAHPSLPSRPSASTIAATSNPSLTSGTSSTHKDKKPSTSLNAARGKPNGSSRFPPRKDVALGPGKKPTLEELIKMNRAKSTGGGGLLSKR